MKKLVVLITAVAGGLLGYRRLTSAKADQALWSEATDSPTTRTPSA